MSQHKWTARKEILQRVLTSWEFIRVAWRCLWTDSATFSREYMRTTCLVADGYRRSKAKATERASRTIDM